MYAKARGCRSGPHEFHTLELKPFLSLPSDHEILNRNPHSGENLPRMDYFGLCDPYLKITVDGYTAKTEVIKVSLNPEWKETINIPIFQARALPNYAALTR